MERLALAIIFIGGLACGSYLTLQDSAWGPAVICLSFLTTWMLWGRPSRPEPAQAKMGATADQVKDETNWPGTRPN